MNDASHNLLNNYYFSKVTLLYNLLLDQDNLVSGNQELWITGSLTMRLFDAFILCQYHHEFLHLSEQYFTSFQTFSHFLRHVKGRPQQIHILVGKFCFFIFLGMA